MSEHHRNDCNSATKRLLDILRKEVFDDDNIEEYENPKPGEVLKRKEMKTRQLSLFPDMDPESEAVE